MPIPSSKGIVALGSTILAVSALSAGVCVQGQSADQAWLRPSVSQKRPAIPLKARALGFGILEETAVREVQLGTTRALGTPPEASSAAGSGEVVLGTLDEVKKAFPNLPFPIDLQPEGYWLYWDGGAGKGNVIIVGADHPGIIYGVFAFFRYVATEQDLTQLNLESNPVLHIRWVDDWDNPDGSVERGYAGRSIFFEGGNVRDDLTPVAEYARLLASVGINGCNLNNVNAAPQLLDHDHLKQLARVADAMRPWGVHLAMSVPVDAPQSVGGMATSDPKDLGVKEWWTDKVKEIYDLIPDFAGFTVKADSEGQPGPTSYGRTPADAANTLAVALASHGVVLYRAFVYNHHLDWEDPKADRAKAAYDIFHPLDGQFAANVVIQTKEGPIDFQAREPVSPLFAGLSHSSQAMEVQITQEYTGQQRHLVYLAPMWKEVLDFDFQINNATTPVQAILSGSTFNQPTGGMVGVAGVGRNGWLGAPLALANLYAFGRLSWDPNLDPEQLATEWTQQTISTDPKVVHTIVSMLMDSWPAYESYTGPLGLQTLTDITGSHYGPNVESSERNGWGQWHKADATGVGFDRSVAFGSKFAGQYPRQIAKLYESPITTPDELLLFFHHVPYNHQLGTGKTVIQYIYDSHYDGAAQAAQFVKDWSTLKGKIDAKLYEDELARLEYQAGHAIVWRDAVVQYFLKLSGIPDEQGRAGKYPGRLEAEDARLAGYKIIEISPWEDASGGKGVSCEGGAEKKTCSAEWTYKGEPGYYNVAVQYFDLREGVAKFELLLNGLTIDSWKADANLPSKIPNGDNSTRHTVKSVELKPGDVLRVEGTPDGADQAALDYIEISAGGPPDAADDPVHHGRMP